MKTTFLRLILPVLLLVCFTSCDEEKGQEQMESSSSLTWEPCSGIQLSEAYSLVDVPAEGTSYALVCTNAHVDWSGIWLNSVQVDGQNLALDEEKHIAEGEWGRIVCKDKYLNMDITPNTTGKERVIEVTPTQIGCFYTFKLTQQPLTVKQNP